MKTPLPRPNNITFNAPATGIIQKSNNHSYFIRMHQNSILAGEIFSKRPKHDDILVMVLQVILTHESWFLVEIVPADKL